jgi:probable FeS assembly SUF system protein SufT
MPDPVFLRRDVEATLLPVGLKVSLPMGTQVTVGDRGPQGVGVTNGRGHQFLLEPRDLDALGQPADTPPTDGPFDPAEPWSRLRTVHDPEIPVNIVDLGLIYACHAHPAASGGQHLKVTMTLTAPGCSMSDYIVAEVHRKLAAVPGVVKVDVELVFDPPWSPEKMSDAAKLRLGLL